MRRASVVELRRALEAAQAMAGAGVAFFPIPALNDQDLRALQAEAFRRLDMITGKSEKDGGEK